MKGLRIFFTMAAMFIGQAVYAEKFQIVNTLDYGIPVQVRTSAGYVFNATIPGKGTTNTIDTGSNQLLWVEWEDGGNEYKGNFAGYREKNNGTVPMQKNKKNFFNISANGIYMHNFPGYKVQETALSN